MEMTPIRKVEKALRAWNVVAGTAIVVVSNEHKEFSRLKSLMEVQAGRLRVSEAATVLQLQRRQVFRLLRSLREHGAAPDIRPCRSRTTKLARSTIV